MDDKTISKISLVIVTIGILVFVATHQEEFPKKTIGELDKVGEKGVIIGRIEYVIKNDPITMFILTDGNKALVYYPKITDLNKNNIVKVYSENEETKTNQKKIFAHKVVSAE
jgi:hypothetical protein